MKLFVANIDKRVTESDLKNLFSGCGQVASVTLSTDRATGTRKGFGFIEMPNDVEAQRAIEQLDEKEIGGQPLSVGQAKPKQKRNS